MAERRRASTATSNFGVGRREGHDATSFYNRFEPPEVSREGAVPKAKTIRNPFLVGDSRHMTEIADGSVALVVTSPPYFAGKQYEEELERDGVPSSYQEYLELLHEVFAECKRKLEPGGRIAVNVANLGRKPYRSLSSDVIRILQDELRLLLRGEVIWRKGEGASGSCAWGSFRSAANPVLRDLTERIVIASKGRFDRAQSVKQRESDGLPFENEIDADEFMAATLDVWDIPPESARRVQHPAPFPVELPERLIHLYTYRNDLVLDPFMGSGSSLVAAAKLGRRYAGYDLDPSYVEIARERVARALEPAIVPEPSGVKTRPRRSTKIVGGPNAVEDFQARATREGKAAQQLAAETITSAGFRILGKNRKIRGTGVTMNFIAVDEDDSPWYFDVSGAFTTTRGGLLRTDTVWKSLGRSHALVNSHDTTPIILLTSHLPRSGSEGYVALHAAGISAFVDAIEMRSNEGFERLKEYARGGHAQPPIPLAGFWSDLEIKRATT
jgi:DNA modification methylase